MLGTSSSGNGNEGAFFVSLDRCVGKEECKSKEEIDEFLTTHDHFKLIYNEQIFFPNDYSENFVRTETKSKAIEMKIRNPKL